MTKPRVLESRFDFRGGRVTSVSPDLLNSNELADATNARLSAIYGSVTKRSGCQRIHASAFPAPVRGVVQWDAPSGKQTVVISNGLLWFRNDFNFTPAFAQAVTSAFAGSTANQGSTAGWLDPDGVDDGTNTVSRTTNGVTTLAAGSRLILKYGDPAIDSNLPASDNVYRLSFKVQSNASGVTGTEGLFR